ncbi:MAG TPA: dTMP kinase [Acidimicrobiia bacterium]|jgi:dTMP kinase|nr:dTMP kinase [Acidimicrobiia bacterium]
MGQARFIVIEGLDGAGTTTQVELVQQLLAADGIEAYKTREPSQGALGAIASLHVSGKLTLDERAMALTFSGDRLDHLAEEIEPQLTRGIWVLCDRYYLSTMAYQGAKLAAPHATDPGAIDWEAADRELAWVLELNRFARVPDLTVFLRVPPAVCAARSRRTRWHRERYDEGAMPHLADAFYDRAIGHLVRRGERVIELDGYDRTADDVAGEIRNLVLDLFGAPAPPKLRTVDETE